MGMLEDIKNTLKDSDIEVADADIQVRIDKMRGFKVPDNEIKRSILTHFGVKSSSTSGDNPIGLVSAITSDGMWTSLRVKIVKLWENKHDSIDQTGIVGDESGTLKFTKWVTAGLPALEEGKSYLLVNVVSSVFNEKMQVSLNKKSKVEPIEDVEVKDNTITFIGAFVSMQDNSGLISRCDVCNRAIRGSCADHGEAESHFDLRIMGSIDNGTVCMTVILDAEIVESLFGYTVESSREMATEALDKEIVGDNLEQLMLGRFYYVSGANLDGTILAKTMMPYVRSIPDKELKGLIEYIRA